MPSRGTDESKVPGERVAMEAAMSIDDPESIARRGTVMDVLYLIGVYEALSTEGRAKLLGAIDLSPRTTIQDIVGLVDTYSMSGIDGKSAFIAAGVELLAEEHLRAQSSAQGEVPTAAEDWLRELASAAMPEYDGAARLISFAAGVEIDAREILFQEGHLATVLSPSELDQSLGEGLLITYESIRDASTAVADLPDPTDYLGIDVPEAEFERRINDEWVFDREAWKPRIADDASQHAPT